jgi:hypothetical protein
MKKVDELTKNRREMNRVRENISGHMPEDIYTPFVFRIYVDIQG